MTDPSAVQQTTNPEKGLTVQQRKARDLERAFDDPDRAMKLLQVMPKGMDPDRFVRTTLIAVQRDPNLLDCTGESIVAAIFEAAECGIAPTGSLGRGYLVPISDHGVKKAEFWIGYPGLIELAMQSERVSKVWSRPVFKGDKFNVRYGTDDRIDHTPQLGAEDIPANLTHVYACVEYKNGVVDFEVLTKEQCDIVRAQARGSNSATSPWQTAYIEQCRKTAIRKLAKRLPLTSEAATAIQKDEEREFGFEERRQKAEAAEKRADSLGDALRERAGRQKAPEKPQDETGAPTAMPEGNAPQQPPTADEAVSTPVASAEQQTETVEGEVISETVQTAKPCLDPSPYGDGDQCDKAKGHKGFHKGSGPGTWGRSAR